LAAGLCGCASAAQASGIAESATAHAENLQIAAIALRAPVANGVDAKVM
jgi:hypothetical protein